MGKEIDGVGLLVSSAKEGDPRLVRSMPIIMKTNENRIIKRSALCGNTNRFDRIA